MHAALVGSERTNIMYPTNIVEKGEVTLWVVETKQNKTFALDSHFYLHREKQLRFSSC
jgi:hypothetical protein